VRPIKAQVSQVKQVEHQETGGDYSQCQLPVVQDERQKQDSRRQQSGQDLEYARMIKLPVFKNSSNFIKVIL